MPNTASKFALLPALALSLLVPASAARAQDNGSASDAPSPVKVEQQKPFTVVGYTVRTNNQAEANGQGKIPALWEQVMQDNSLAQIPNAVGDGFIVVYSGYAMGGSGDFDYTLGVRVSSVGTLPAGTKAITIDPGRYAVVQSEQGPPQEVIPAVWQRIAAMTPQELGGTRAYKTDFETYPDVSDFSSIQMTAHVGLK
jgi:predicted transcriptional regulator YdeE